jgi:ubiquinone/menaquinone biosynthesis C-methylase UbiE
MPTNDRQAHWQNLYLTKAENEVSWFQATPAISLEMIDAAGIDTDSAIIDVGGGSSRLVDSLVGRGYRNVTVLDLSEAALSVAKTRLGDNARAVEWIVADTTRWKSGGKFDLWHDPAAFQFLTEDRDRSAYISRLKEALRTGGTAIIASFSLEGPEKCSGLPVQRYDAASLGEVLGSAFRLMEARDHEHHTPWGSVQRFQFSRFIFDQSV